MAGVYHLNRSYSFLIYHETASDRHRAGGGISYGSNLSFAAAHNHGRPCTAIWQQHPALQCIDLCMLRCTTSSQVILMICMLLTRCCVYRLRPTT